MQFYSLEIRFAKSQKLADSLQTSLICRIKYRMSQKPNNPNGRVSFGKLLRTFLWPGPFLKPRVSPLPKMEEGGALCGVGRGDTFFLNAEGPPTAPPPTSEDGRGAPKVG